MNDLANLVDNKHMMRIKLMIAISIRVLNCPEVALLIHKESYFPILKWVLLQAMRVLTLCWAAFLYSDHRGRYSAASVSRYSPSESDTLEKICQI